MKLKKKNKTQETMKKKKKHPLQDSLQNSFPLFPVKFIRVKKNKRLLFDRKTEYKSLV